MEEQKQHSWDGSVYRSEILAKRAERLSGDVVIAVPLSWRIIGYFITIAVAGIITFLFLARYSRVETALGAIVPDKGIAAIVPSRNGVITHVHVKYGERVDEGNLLVSISVEEQLADGMSAAERVVAAMALQDSSLLSQLASAREATRAQLEQIAAERAGAVAEIAQIEAQIVLQKGLVASARTDLESAKALGERGFVTTRDLKLLDVAFVSRQQQLAELQQRLASRTAARQGLERSAAAVTAQAKAQASNLAAIRAQIEQQAANVKGSRSYVLKAPFAGKVTALTARVGRYASADQPLLSIVPDGATLHAELSVPTNAIAFIRSGQEVRLAIDAFPYQRFGTLAGSVTTISESAVSVRTPAGATRSMYPVFVKLDKQSMYAFGQQHPLVPDMTLTARIVTDKQTLIEWLFEPLFAVLQR